MYRYITECRACSGTQFQSAFDLGIQPLANDFVGPTWYKQGKVIP